MKRILIGLAVLCILSAAYCNRQHSSAVIKVHKETLMNEVRATPSPLDGSHITMNPPRFMWPDKFPHLGAVLDGVPGYVDEKPKVLYRIRISRDKFFKQDVITSEQPYAFFNPFKVFEKGEWFWQYAYVTPKGDEEWSPVYSFHIGENVPVFNPPSLDEVLTYYSLEHPRVLLDNKEWDEIRKRNKNNPEASGYIKKATSCLLRPLKHLQEEIDTSNVVTQTNIVQKKSALIRESRKIVDREEANVEALVRAYLLTKDEKYYREGVDRLTEILSWQSSKYFAGDFNLSTLLSMSTSVYDGFYPLLTEKEKGLLLNSIRVLGNKFYEEYINHLENRIADNHVWQMTFRILTMAAFATIGEIPEAEKWADYCYNEWISRMPGLNRDGAWHNGDSYFHVNIRTLIEVPAFFSRISGFNFFADPWYDNNALYVVYQQPPFSKSGGHGNSHENQRTPTGGRVGYADALARETLNPWVTAYVHEILQKDPQILSKAFEAKSQDLTWYRCTTKKDLPSYSKKLTDLPPVKVFNETGTALMHTNIGHYETNAMLSFRSSPYGGTSHALANQNSFNTFYGGKAIFYSTGHRTGFTDDHCMYAYRNTRAHNSILPNGMTQKIGTEGYGWISRYYEGNKISYVVGDASNAYGQVTSPLWLERARLSGTQFTPEMGWDENKVNMFRRHVVQLGNSGLYVIYDELEGKDDIAWNYLLHTTELPMEVREMSDGLRIIGRNSANAVSVSHLFSSAPMTFHQTDTFFVAPIDWKKRLKKKLKNHYHFTAITQPTKRVCFLNILDVHGDNRTDALVMRNENRIVVGDWTIECNLNGKDAFLKISNKKENVLLSFDYESLGGKTVITDCSQNGEEITIELKDRLPDLEI